MEDKIVYEIGPAAGESGDYTPKLGSMPWQLTHDPLYRDEEPMWSANEKRIFSNVLGGRATNRSASWGQIASIENVTSVLPISDDPVGSQWRAEESWSGFYGYLDCQKAFDWRQPA